MQRLVRIHCRGAPSARIRPLQNHFHREAFSTFRKAFRPEGCLRHTAFTWQYRAAHTKSRFSGRFIASPWYVLTAATIPLAQKKEEEDAGGDMDITLEQSLLDTSEEERREQVYGVSKDRSLFYRCCRHIKITFLRYVFEPIATAVRFVQLVFIFVPVIVTIPIIFIGSRDPERDHERTGTLWWYSFLVKQMERAGATFIKVESFKFGFADCSWDNGQLPERTSSPLSYVCICPNSIPMSKHIDSLQPNELSKLLSMADHLIQSGLSSMRNPSASVLLLRFTKPK